MTWRGEAGKGEDVAGAGTMTVVQTVAEAHMWPMAETRGADVQTVAEAPLALASQSGHMCLS